MYLQHYNLFDEPFRLAPDPGYLYLSNIYSLAKSYIDFAIWNNDGFVVITGEIGCGKTTVVNAALSSLEENIVIVKIHFTQIDEVQLLQLILKELNYEVNADNKIELVSLLKDFLVKQYEKKRKVLLVIDEAQNLSTRVLEEVRLLSGIETLYSKLIHIILVGQPELREKLESKELEQLSQRIRLKIHIKPLTHEETCNYIKYRLAKAGCNELSLFDYAVYSYIYRYTGGIPRLINIMCDTALIIGFADGAKKIDVPIIKHTIKELNWVTYKRRKQKLQNNYDNEKSKKKEFKVIETVPIELEIKDNLIKYK